MNFENLTEDKKKEYSEALLAPIENAEHLRHWCLFFLGLDLPYGTTDPESTSSPLDAIWSTYISIINNTGDTTPGYIWLSARECLKTVSSAVTELLLMLHAKIEIAHAAAIESQSSVNLDYINGFIGKIKPLLDYAGWVQNTANKRTIKFKTPDGKTTYIKVLICNVKGMNSLHVQCMFLDELDLADPKALKQAKNIIGYSKGIYGVTVYLSTRKFAFGNMNDAVESAGEKNYQIKRWNILDVTEYCAPSRHDPEGPKEDRYVGNNLPLEQIKTDAYEVLPAQERTKWSLVKDAHAGCLKCPILPICRKRLAEKPKDNVGGFYKPIVSVIQKFKDNDPETAEAELLCWRPGSQGLVFPRFKKDENLLEPTKTNVISLGTAYHEFTGKTNPHISEDVFIRTLKDAGVEFFAGVDWGFTHDAVIVMCARLPDGQIWVVDCFSSPGLEFSDMLEQGIRMRDIYAPQKWYCDQAMPSHIKSFNKNGMKSPVFTKDIISGIEALRSKMVSSTGKRLFKAIRTPSTKKLINAVAKHRFILDGSGNPTSKPDDEPQIADICDALRYIGQNLFPVKGPQKPIYDITGPDGKPLDGSTPEGRAELAKMDTNTQLMMNEINKRLAPDEIVRGSGKKGGFFYSF